MQKMKFIFLHDSTNFLQTWWGAKLTLFRLYIAKGSILPKALYYQKTLYYQNYIGNVKQNPAHKPLSLQ